MRNYHYYGKIWPYEWRYIWVPNPPYFNPWVGQCRKVIHSGSVDEKYIKADRICWKISKTRYFQSIEGWMRMLDFHGLNRMSVQNSEIVSQYNRWKKAEGKMAEICI